MKIPTVALMKLKAKNKKLINDVSTKTLKRQQSFPFTSEITSTCDIIKINKFTLK